MCHAEKGGARPKEARNKTGRGAYKGMRCGCVQVWRGAQQQASTRLLLSAGRALRLRSAWSTRAPFCREALLHGKSSPHESTGKRCAADARRARSREAVPVQLWRLPWCEMYCCAMAGTSGSADEGRRKKRARLSAARWRRRERERERSLPRVLPRRLQPAPGLQSVSKEQMDSRTLEMVSAGLHWSLRMSRQMLPLLLMLQW